MSKWDDPKPEFKWPVAVARPISASTEDVWRAISMPGNLELCHPFCDKNPVENWPGEGSRDVIYYLNGRVLTRCFLNWIDGVGYDLEIGRQGGRLSFVSWRIIPREETLCILRITIYPHMIQHIPLAIRWFPHVVTVRPKLSSYLASVVKGFDWFVTQGQAVSSNQFGTHPWFS